jgi:uncharacterized protein YbjQ (UPF0145 family)
MNDHHTEGAICAVCLKTPSRQRDFAAEQRARDAQEAAETAGIMLTTETSVELNISVRLGIVTAECVVGMHVFKDIAASFRDVFGGRSDSVQSGLREAKNTALNELRAEARKLKANAVIAVTLTYSEIAGGGKSMLLVAATGTAVKIADVETEPNG